MEGTTLSHFLVRTKLGEGGMGVVYRADDLKLGRPVALKVLRPAFQQDESRLRRFIQEARSAAAVTHPSIATIHEIGDADGVLFIAMEFVDGSPLRTLLAGRPLPIGEAVRIAVEIASGLAKAHEVGVVHRDLKPDNIMLTREGGVKILDFGLAKLLDEPQAESEGALSQMATTPDQLTREGKVFGTAAYMSPEQARGKPIDARSDVFSFGVVVYELVTGRVPFEGETVTDTLSAIIRDPATPAAERNPEVPVSLDRILARCLEKDRVRRYASTRDLVGELGASARELGVASPTASLVGLTTHTHDGYRSATTTPVPSSSSGAAPAASGEAAAHPRLLGRRWQLAAVLALALVVVGAAAFGLRKKPRPEAALVAAAGPLATLAVHTFENLSEPGDAARMGQILQELIITDLSELQGLRVLSSQRLFDVQKQLTGKDERRFDRDAATDIAQRVGASAMLTGSLSKLGDTWILTSQLVDVKSGAIEASQRTDGSDLYAMVDQLTDLVRADLRLTTGGPGRDLAIRQKTTSSLPAYQLMLRGIEQLNQQEFEKATALFDSSIAQDPKFSDAYYHLAIARWWAGDNPEHAREPLSRLVSGELKSNERERRIAAAAMDLLDQKYGEAEKRYRSLVADFPDEKEAWYGLGEATYHGTDGKRNEALDAFEKAVELDPSFFLAYRHIFDIYAQQGLKKESVRLARLVADQSTSFAPWLQWLRSVSAQGDSDALRASIAEVKRRFPEELNDLRVSALEGECLLAQGRVEEAAALFRRVVDGSPPREGAAIMTALSRALRTMWVRDEAETWALRAAEGTSGSHDPYRELATLYSMQGRWQDGAAFLRRTPAPRHLQQAFGVLFYAVSPESDSLATCLAALGKLRGVERVSALTLACWGFFAAGNYHAADSLLEATPDVSTTASPELGSIAAFSALHRLDLVEAETTMLRLLGMDATLQPVLCGLTALYAREGRFDEAITYARRSLQLYPQDPISYMGLIGTFAQAGQLQRADSVVAASAHLGPAAARRAVLTGRAMPSSGAGWTFLALGDIARARAVGRRAAALDAGGRDASVPALLGWCELLAGAPAKALPFFEQARRGSRPRSDDSALALTSIAVSCLELGRLDDAERYARQVLTEGPRHVRVLRVLAYALAAQERFEEAEVVARRALAMDDGDDSNAALAWILVASGRDVKHGIALAERAIELESTFSQLEQTLSFVAPPEHTLGLAALREGRYDEAVEQLEAAATKYPKRTAIQKDLERARTHTAVVG